MITLLTGCAGLTSPDPYTTVYLPSDISLFASGEASVWGGFFNVFALDVQEAGHEINIFYPDDYGMHSYDDVLITTDELIAQSPDLVESIEGFWLENVKLPSNGVK